MELKKITNEELKSYGCATCFWKANGQCEYNLKDNQTLPEDICPEYAVFLSNFSRGSNSINVMLENFNLYMAQMQSSEDYKEMKQLEKEIAELLAKGDNQEATELSHKRMLLKIFWQRANFDLTKGYSRTNDRAVKEDKTVVHIDKINLMNIHKIVNNTRKELESKK